LLSTFLLLNLYASICAITAPFPTIAGANKRKAPDSDKVELGMYRGSDGRCNYDLKAKQR
jgi:hypothetical protein